MEKLRALSLAIAFTAWAMVGLAQLASPRTAFAQDTPAGGDAEDAASSRSATFQAMEGPTTEDVPGGPLLVGAYGVVLGLLLGYVLWLGALQTVTSRDIARLAKVIERAESGPKVG